MPTTPTPAMHSPTVPSPAARRPVHNSASATALMLLAELVAPIALFYGLRSAGAGIYVAVILGGLGPALTTTVKAIRHHRVDTLGVAVLITLVVSAGVSLMGGGPQFLLAKDSLLTAAWGSWFFVSLWSERPLTFRFSRPLLEGRKIFDPRTRRWVATKGISWDELWERVPRFGHVWRVTTVMWGAAMVVDALLRVAMAYSLPADLVPGLGGALWLVTFIALQVITNIYFLRSGLWTILLGDTPR
ncbi:MAG: hypothetical protein M3011_12295 [Actinomycetota bacterium]|nr:hypothetical protein [Actinomycetota bacterium]